MTETVVASFYRDDPAAAELPWKVDYRACLAMLDASVRAHGHEHVVITDAKTVAAGLPCPAFTMQFRTPVLMHAFMRGQAEFLAAEAKSSSPRHVALVGADTLMWTPMPDLDGADWDLLVTSRPPLGAFGRINNGCVIIPAPSLVRTGMVWQDIADHTGPVWGDDQRAIEDALSPIPDEHGIGHRQGLRVVFAPMAAFNHAPTSLGDVPDPAPLFLHFKGNRKSMMADFAARMASETAKEAA